MVGNYSLVPHKMERLLHLHIRPLWPSLPQNGIPIGEQVISIYFMRTVKATICRIPAKPKVYAPSGGTMTALPHMRNSSAMF